MDDGIDVIQVSGEDWVAIYFDGIRVSQGHDINFWEVMLELVDVNRPVRSFKEYDTIDFYEGSLFEFPEILDLKVLLK